MDAQMKRGMVEVCILSLLTRSDSYGYQLIKDVEPIMTLSESTLYPVLRRLEGAGCLTVYSVEHNSRLRKYYAITDEGRKRIADFMEEWADVKRVYDFIAEVNRDGSQAFVQPSPD
jgi:PadR family transcriptional regulator PadR